MRYKNETARLNKKYKSISRKSGCLSVVCLVLMMGSLGRFLLATSQGDVLQDDLEEKLSFLKSNSRYEYKMLRDKAELFEDYKNGEISFDGFEDGLEYIGSQEYFIDWARSLDEDFIDRLIDNYDREERKRKIDAACSGVSAIASGVMMLANTGINIDYKDRSRELNCNEKV